MASFKLLRWLGLLYLLLVGCLKQASAIDVSRIFSFPVGTTQDSKDEVHQAFRDAMTLARLVAITAIPCEESFLRYFQPGDFILVSRVFRAIANVGFDQQFDVQNVEQILERMKTEASLNPKFEDLSIALDDNPDAQLANGMQGGSQCNDPKMINAAVMTYNRAIWGVKGIMSFCRQTLESYYSLHDIENPPEWARDGQGQPEEGFGCDNMLGRDTNYMLSPGAIMLHELMHWPYLFVDIPEYSQWVAWDGGPTGAPRIDDYQGMPGTYPPDGYGPFHAQALRHAPVSFATGKSQAIQNADSYLWYALDKYWTWRCKKQFGPAIAESDASVRGFLMSEKVPPVSSGGGP